MAVKHKASPALRADMTVAAAIQTILRHHFAVMLDYEARAREGTDIEGVHQMRVALRRLRSALSLFRSLLDPEQTRLWRDAMRDLAGQLGRARDLDVFIDEGLADTAGKLPLPGEARLRELALRQRATVYEQEVRPMLDSDSYQRFCAEFPRWIEQGITPAEALEGQGACKLSRPIVSRARKLLDKQERRVLNAGRFVDRHDAPAMHQLRIEGKKLRYAAEFFRPLFSDMGTFISCMKGIQDVLGVMNDLALTQSLLDELLSSSPDERELHAYAGALIGWRSYHFHVLLEDFDNRWEALVAARRPWWD